MHITETTQDLIFGTFEDQVKRTIATTLGQWAVQLLISNSVFFILRIVLAKLAYAAYELGRDAVFSILLMLLTATVVVAGVAYFLINEPLQLFLRDYKMLIFLILALWTVTIWYWRRYIFRSRANRTVFDHEIGALLVSLQR